MSELEPNQGASRMQEQIEKLIEWYDLHIGISLKPTPLRSFYSDPVFIPGKWVLASRHPYKSHCWLWALYYDANKPILKRFNFMRQKPVWKENQ